MNPHHKALARWSLAIRATDNALKRLITIGDSNCSNEAYVTTQIANADDYLVQALEHIRSFSAPAKWNPPPGVKEQLARREKEELARTFVPSAVPPKPPKEHDPWLDHGGFPGHDAGCACNQCDGGVAYE